MVTSATVMPTGPPACGPMGFPLFLKCTWVAVEGGHCCLVFTNDGYTDHEFTEMGSITIFFRFKRKNKTNPSILYVNYIKGKMETIDI